MKRIALLSISFYQQLFSVILKQLFGIPAFCRYSPTCSDYTKHAIQKYGFFKGGVLGLKRLSTCHPFTRYGTV